MSLTTRIYTWLRGALVGTDSFGNRYYRARSRRAGREFGRERRWVMYAGEPEASAVPPLWHAWLHYQSDTPPTDAPPARPWQKEHEPNLTGTPAAYRPPGHVYQGGNRAKATGDYEAWKPD